MTDVRLAVLIMALLSILPACRSQPIAEQDPGQVALGLFALARTGDPSDAELERLFGTETRPESRAVLLEALSTLAQTTTASVVRAQQPAGATEAFVDLVAGLPGGGEAHYNVRLAAPSPGVWQVTWFQGPGVEWPPSRPRRGESLSTSLPPETTEAKP